MYETWDGIRLQPEREDLIWEVFHENSKTSRYVTPPSNESVMERMKCMYESLPLDEYPSVELSSRLARLDVPLEQAIVRRVTARQLQPCKLSLEIVATILHYAYGVTRDNRDTDFPRPFRVVPSGGALYPLEIFFHSVNVEQLVGGLYHYNPASNKISLIREGDQALIIADALIQKELAYGAALFFFITAVFERSTFKYGDRGYRFVLIEAGHVGQNISLVANALGLGCVNVGGFYDRKVDDLLGLDGLTHSTIYAACIGGSASA